MKRLVVLVLTLLALSAARTEAAISILGTTVTASGNGTTSTTGSVSTSTCSPNCAFFVLCTTSNGSAFANTGAASDSTSSNTYVAALADGANSAVHWRIYYAVSVTTSGSMTFSCTGSGSSFPGAIGVWATGVKQTSPVDNSGIVTCTSCNSVPVPASSLTAAGTGDLMISLATTDGSSAASAVSQSDGGTLTHDFQNLVGGQNYAISGAYSVLSGSSDQVTWSIGGGIGTGGASIVVFLPASGGPPPTSCTRGLTLVRAGC